jgi:hypothetical protein
VIESEREETVTVGRGEQVPEPAPRSAIRLHEQYDADGWRVTGDGHLAYGRGLAPGGSTVTGFFLRGGAAVARRVFVAPSIESVRRAEATAIA